MLCASLPKKEKIYNVFQIFFEPPNPLYCKDLSTGLETYLCRVIDIFCVSMNYYHYCDFSGKSLVILSLNKKFNKYVFYTYFPPIIFIILLAADTAVKETN